MNHLIKKVTDHPAIGYEISYLALIASIAATALWLIIYVLRANWGELI